MTDDGETIKARINHEYGITLTAERAEKLGAEVEQVLAMARKEVPRLSFDQEPADFPAALLNHRDPG
jgi:hypothetical protein